MQLVCIFLLLFSQQVALTHAAWHAGSGAGGEPAAHAHDGHHDETPVDASCAFDLVFGNVLGGHGAAGAFVPDLAPDLEFFTWVSSPRLALDAVPAVSRGPPAYR